VDRSGKQEASVEGHARALSRRMRRSSTQAKQGRVELLVSLSTFARRRRLIPSSPFSNAKE
jgi:hypothetical protein